nr:unnamed protein product [Callosobruchus analis]
MIQRFLELEDAIRATVAILDAPLQTLTVGEWLQMKIDTRLGRIEENNTFLDPRLKNLALQDPRTADKTKKVVIGLVSEYILEKRMNLNQHDDNVKTCDRDCNNFSVWDTFDVVVATHKPQGTASSKANIEVQRYLEDSLIPRDKDPLQWWSEHAYNYPNLSIIVQERYCALGTSVPCERCFSDAGMYLNERRASLSSKNMKYLISLHTNAKYKKQYYNFLHFLVFTEQYFFPCSSSFIFLFLCNV